MSDSRAIQSYRFDPFDLDPRAYRLRRQGRAVRLERRPMDLLILFVERRGELVTRTEIAARLWPQDVFIEIESAVNTVVWKLRSALRDSSESPRFIETVPGKGYRFIAPTQGVTAEAGVRSPDAARSWRPGDVSAEAAVPSGPPIAGAEAIGAQRGASRGRQVRTDTLRPAPVTLRIGALIAVVLLLGTGWLFVRSPRRPTTIAVLPFENLSEDRGRDYLADGLHEEVLASLGQLSPDRLRVIGRRSTLGYRGTTASVAQIGRDLAADFLVEGSMRVEGDQVRLRATLLRVADQAQLWSESYTRKLSDVLGLQVQLSTAIAEQITTRLGASEAGALSSRQTRDAEAYDLYLRGLSLSRLRTPAGNLGAIEHYRRAIDRDPHYALAWAGIADVYSAMPINADAPPLAVAADARLAAQRAVAADGQLGEVLVTEGFVSYYFDWNWTSAEASLRRAVAASPGLAIAHRLLGHVLSQMSRHDEAQEAMRRAVDLDPLDPMNHALAAQVAFQRRDYPAAFEHARRATTLDPGFWIGYMQEAQVDEQLGQTALALQALATGDQYSGGNSKGPSLRGYILAKTGRASEAREELRVLATLAKDRFVPPYASALIYAGLGERDEVFQWLERAYEVHDVHLMYLTVDPKWDPYRSDPRFENLLVRCGFRTSD
jgi:TolB-like protein/DNA-binding winged helix-turn-helix (wHTH) protein